MNQTTFIGLNEIEDKPYDVYKKMETMTKWEAEEMMENFNVGEHIDATVTENLPDSEFVTRHYSRYLDVYQGDPE